MRYYSSGKKKSIKITTDIYERMDLCHFADYTHMADASKILVYNVVQKRLGVRIRAQE